MNRFRQSVLFIFCCLISVTANGQFFTYSGTVVNDKLEPIPFINVSIKDIKQYNRTNEQGRFSFRLSPGRYELVFSRLGYKTLQKVIILNKDEEENILLEADNQQLAQITITAKQKDRSKEIISNTIRIKKDIQKSALHYSYDAYVKASAEENAKQVNNRSKKNEKKEPLNEESGKHFAEVYLNVHRAYPDKLKEIREAVNIKGNKDNLFYLSCTEGDFNFYDNLIRIRALGPVSFLSPFSVSGLITYRYQYLGSEFEKGIRYHHIRFRPSTTSNALLTGEVWIQDHTWIIKKIRAAFPNAHTPLFQSFEINASYQQLKQQIWLPEAYTFQYRTREKVIGQTAVRFTNYIIDTIYDKRFFNTEVSATTLEAYEKDSSFWDVVRPVPLSSDEIKIIHYRDSIYESTHSDTYLDSMEAEINKIRILNILWRGQDYQNWRKEKTIEFPSLPALFRPFDIGGPRYGLWFNYEKRFKDKTELKVSPFVNYSHVNKDFRGNLKAYYLANPFTRTSYSFNIGRSTSNLFWNDAFINLFDRSNYFLRENIILSARREIVNGLYINNALELGFRRSMHNYIINTTWDSLLGRELPSRPIFFNDYSAFFNELEISYTPHQLYIREPYQKAILGSRYPTFFVKWRKGIPGILKSIIAYDYIEIGLRQDLNLGTLGISDYNLMYGNFLNEGNVEAADYKFIARGNPYLFFNSRNMFQAMDSTFALFKGFVEGHLTHEFNGALINKIPYMRKLKLSESAGGGLLIAPERKLRYMEIFAGIEKQIVILNQPLRFGVWGVSSFANQFQRPFLLKFSIRVFDQRTNTWN